MRNQQENLSKNDNDYQSFYSNCYYFTIHFDYTSRESIFERFQRQFKYSYIIWGLFIGRDYYWEEINLLKKHFNELLSSEKETVQHHFLNFTKSKVKPL